MWQVCNALPHRPQLCSLQAWAWTCKAGSDSQRDCWQLFASVLPTMRCLTRLELSAILLPFCSASSDAACLTLLSSGLSQMPWLRSLAITGKAAQQLSAMDGYATASEALTRSIGALTGLTKLQLSNMRGAVTVQDCSRHLRALTELRSLALSWWICAPEDEPRGCGLAGAEAIAGMLLGKTQLTRLELICASHANPATPATTALYCDPLLGLPNLEELSLVAAPAMCVATSPSALLAEKMAGGQLACLRRLHAGNMPAFDPVALNLS